MSVRSRMQISAGIIACAAIFAAAPAAAQCWSGGAPGQGVPRESLLVTNRAPFAVNVMAGPAGGARRVLGQVPGGTTMSFASVLPPGRNETTIWVDPGDEARYRLAASRVTGAIVIANRREATCRRAARLEITPAVFDAQPRRGTDVARRNDLGRLAPAAGPRARRPAAPPATTAAARQPGPPSGGAGIVRY